MLRQRKNMLQKRKDMVLIERKKKMVERKEKMVERKKKEKEEEKERQHNKKLGNECSSWQTPPEDIMEKILQFVEFADQGRLGQVSKSWRSIVSQTLMPSVRRQLPWLILPESQNCKINKHVSFLTFPENKLSKGKVVKLKLPRQLQGGWIYGSSRGWLIIINEKGLNSEICLLNPISGALHKLPPLETIPSFKRFVKTRKWKLLGVKGFFECVRMSSASDGFDSSSNFIVAAVLDDRKTLGVCRLGDEKWCVFPILDVILDILFSSGTLYALVLWSEQNGSSIAAPTRTLDFAFHDAEHLKLKLIVDKQEDMFDEYDITDYKIVSTSFWSMLLESTNKEVLLVHQLNDYVLKTKNDGEGNGSDGVRHRTRSFITYKIDPETNHFDKIQALGDQILFFGNGGAFSLPASNIKEIENNCIYFAMNLYREVDMEWLPKTYISDEIGIFYLDGQTILRPFRGMKMSVKSQTSWFTPTL